MGDTDGAVQKCDVTGYKDKALAYLRDVIVQTGKTASELADLADVSPSTFTRPLNSPAFKYAPKYQHLARVAAKTGVPLPADLAQGEALPLPDTFELPIRYTVAAGAWEALDEYRDEPLGYELANRVAIYADFPQWLERVVGDSYNLKIPDGYLVHVVDAIAMSYVPRSGDTVVVKRSRHQGSFVERTLKEVIHTPFGMELWPRSHNPKYNEPLIYKPTENDSDDVEVEIVGKVIRSYQAFGS